jgi:hypothetical protein
VIGGALSCPIRIKRLALFEHTVDQPRQFEGLLAQLAAQHKADVTCPITVGFHLRTVAEAAFEQVQQGKAWAEVTPFWRVIDAKSPTLKRLSFDPAVVLRMRQAEGLAGSPAATAAASNCPHLK